MEGREALTPALRSVPDSVPDSVHRGRGRSCCISKELPGDTESAAGKPRAENPCSEAKARAQSLDFHLRSHGRQIIRVREQISGCRGWRRHRASFWGDDKVLEFVVMVT